MGRKFAPTDLAKKAKHAIAIDLLLFPGGTFPIIKVLAAASQELSTTNIQIENLYNKLTFRGDFWSMKLWKSKQNIWYLDAQRCPMVNLLSNKICMNILAAASQELSTTNIQIENLYNKLTLGD